MKKPNSEQKIPPADLREEALKQYEGTVGDVEQIAFDKEVGELQEFSVEVEQKIAKLEVAIGKICASEAAAGQTS
ncbi:MAG: hypothetical protein WCW02_00795 [Candidatus Buchananbacteria bacterium]